MNEEIIKYNEALSYAAKFCSTAEKCKFDIIKKLKLRDLNENQIYEIIKYLEENKFIDEQRYANYYTADKFKFAKWGKKKIIQALKLKNISENNIRTAIKNISDTDYFLTLEHLIIKKNKTLKDTDLYKRKSKILRFALSKGFENQIIFDAMDKIL